MYVEFVYMWMSVYMCVYGGQSTTIGVLHLFWDTVFIGLELTIIGLEWMAEFEASVATWKVQWCHV